MRRGTLFLVALFSFCVGANAQGTTCTNAITIPLDGTCNSYNVSDVGGNAIHCTGGPYGGGAGGRVTYFSFTTNATPQCVSLDMETSVAGESIEAVLFTGCSGGTPTGGNAFQSVCMDDGDGIWATNLWNSNLLPNTTYYLRVRTESGFTGSIQICGKSETPTNNLCSGSLGIDELTTPNQNNACNTGSTEVAPGNLCAGSLENTAWYTYTVLTSGVSSIIISNLNCDNANFAGNNDYGFQIGFFTGNCGSLTPTNCIGQTGAAGGTVIASSTSLPAGTVVHVAIDGFAGSNCKYDILAINAAPLPVKLKYFEGWKGVDFNLLTWATLSELNNLYFEVERSNDGINFTAIGRTGGQVNSNSEKRYSFKDKNPFQISYYRLKQMDIHGSKTYSRIIRVVREYPVNKLKVMFQNPSGNMMKLNIESSLNGKAILQVIDAMGRIMLTEQTLLQKGLNQHIFNLSNLAGGNYYLIIKHENEIKTVPFIKNIY